MQCKRLRHLSAGCVAATDLKTGPGQALPTVSSSDQLLYKGLQAMGLHHNTESTDLYETAEEDFLPRSSNVVLPPNSRVEERASPGPPSSLRISDFSFLLADLAS
mmetsp:Transcript_84077/g.246623  ORF Transcript_84077/g.246623 Transcript_84077/m.246623 type:complete len:105 (-) Transcript_84077:2017-2331(-)